MSERIPKLTIAQLKYLRKALQMNATERRYSVFFSIWACGKTHTDAPALRA